MLSRGVFNDLITADSMLDFFVFFLYSHVILIQKTKPSHPSYKAIKGR